MAKILMSDGWKGIWPVLVGKHRLQRESFDVNSYRTQAFVNPFTEGSEGNEDFNLGTDMTAE
jgi:hypothetical protein